MSFQFYSNIISQASRRLAGGMLAAGIGLISFGLLIFLLPVLFATLAAAVFFVAGIGTCITALKMLLTQRRIDKEIHNESNEYRENVRIRIEDH
jgi:hypothetical protein